MMNNVAFIFLNLCLVPKYACCFDDLKICSHLCYEFREMLISGKTNMFYNSIDSLFVLGCKRSIGSYLVLHIPFSGNKERRKWNEHMLSVYDVRSRYLILIFSFNAHNSPFLM